MIVLLLALLMPAAQGRSVEVGVTAPWREFSSNLVLETAEYLRDFPSESKQAPFWAFLHNLCQHSSVLDSYFQAPSDAQQQSAYKMVVANSTRPLIPSHMRSLSDTILGLGYHSASVPFFESLAVPFVGQCGEAAEVVEIALPAGEVRCDSSASPYPLLESQGTEISEDFDYVFSSPSAAQTQAQKIVYGRWGSSAFCARYAEAQRQVEAGEIKSFAVRPLLQVKDAIQRDTAMFGYGVFLDIKNMEYKNVDDESVSNRNSNNNKDNTNNNEKAPSKDSTEFPADEEVQGINFSKLSKNVDSGEARKELVMLRERLQQDGGDSSEGEGAKMKIWKIRDLGLQLLTNLHSITDRQHRVERLVETVGNFPSVVSSLSSVKPTQVVREALETLLQYNLPVNALYINNYKVDLNQYTFNLFDVLKRLKDINLFYNTLYSLPLLNSKQRQALNHLATHFSTFKQQRSIHGTNLEAQLVGDLVRIDISKNSKGVIHFLNNLEKDVQYKQWSKSLKTLLYPSWSIHSIAKNLYTTLLVVDISSAVGSKLVVQSQQMMSQGYPIRFGIVHYCGASAVMIGYCKLYSKVSEEGGQVKGTEFMTQIANIVSEQYETMGSADLTFDILVDVYISVASRRQDRDSIEALITSPSESQQSYLQANVDYLDLYNLPVNCVLMNGIVIDDSNGDLSQGEEFMQSIMREQYLISSYVKQGLIVDKGSKTSIYNEILARGNVFSRYHPVLSYGDNDNSIELMYVNSKEGVDLVHSLAYFANTIDSSASSSDKRRGNNIIFLLLNFDSKDTNANKHSYSTLYNALEFVKSTNESTYLSVLMHVEDGDGDDINVNQCDIGNAGDGVCSQDSKENVHKHLLSLYTSLLHHSSVPHSLDNGEVSICRSDCLDNLQQVVAHMVSAIGKENGLNDIEEIVGKDNLGLIDGNERHNVVKRNMKKLNGQYQAIKQLLTNGESAGSSNDAIVVYNSRVFTQDIISHPIHAQDFSLFENIQQKDYSSTTQQYLASEFPNLVSDRFLHSVYTLLINSYVMQYTKQYSTSSKRDSKDVFGLLEDLYANSYVDYSPLVYEIEPPLDYSYSTVKQDIKLALIIDPLSTAGQRATSLLKLFTQLRYTYTLILLPKAEYNEMPLQSYYRYALHSLDIFNTLDTESSELQEDIEANTPEVSAADRSFAGVKFTNLPRQHVLTTRTDIPEAWNVQTHYALQDIDNLRCIKAMPCGDHSTETTSIVYTLKSLLVAGQCFQTTAENVGNGRFAPPNGLQIILYDNANTTNSVSDSLVMQNLGYYQLQAPTPGLYTLSLAVGRAFDLYYIYNSNKAGNVKDNIANGQKIALKDFSDHIRRFYVVKRPGLEDINLLDDNDIAPVQQASSTGTLWNKISTFFNSNNNDNASEQALVKEDDTIHVFSLATGHMYERLLRIMMLSVYKRSSRPLKFWLFENYLSPSFKQLASAMSVKYGFQVQYVTYKWPQWLHPQTQQQRIIWGYKILFLDVLFPLNVKKVIYVDSDQVVRADLAELWDMDLNNAPYAYVPFCTSRKETLGFQFWRSGYWKEHLQGRPYHISALYVVDLARFRRYAVGDMLRGVYDQLSRDPNSLANLDQDLPNYAQHQVPIFSLPQEWLWCESWCSDGSKSTAKTIDLCNNPMHKEPKLDMARRVISGSLFNESWVQLDEEIKSLAKEEGLMNPVEAF